MSSSDLARFEALFEAWIADQAPADTAHDPGHVRRVVSNCRLLTEMENAEPWVTIPAAWLHDCVAVAKDSADRPKASSLAAAAAAAFLASNDFPADLIAGVSHAIEAHSYSAGIEPKTLEARVVQDADRLDSLGALGIARCLMVGGKLDRALFSEKDPFCQQRLPDDSRFTLDHFYAKLLKLPERMQTDSGRTLAQARVGVMQRFLEDLRREIRR